MGGTSIPAPSSKLVRAPRRILALRADDVLVERVRAGDSVAFEVLYSRHVPGVLAFCRHMLGDAGEAEDAVQASFVSAHRDLLRDERDINFKPWLYTIARNRCISVLRSRRDRSEAEPELQTAGLSDEVQQRADLRELVADLHDLPADQRAALVLSEMGDLSQAEVAGVLGCGVSNVKGLVFRARAGLSERREARAAACDEIREELASARRGGLKRGRLRHHVKACPGCAAYLQDLRSQRKMLAVALPVVPSLGLRDTVLAAAGIGGGAGGAAATGGGLALLGSGSTIAKVAVVGALAGGAGVAAPSAVEQMTDDSEPARAAPAQSLRKPAASTPARPASSTPAPAARKERPQQSRRGRKVRRRGAGTPGAAAPGRAKAPGLTRAPGPKAQGQGKPAATGRPAPATRRPATPPPTARKPMKARGGPVVEAPAPRAGPKAE